MDGHEVRYFEEFDDANTRAKPLGTVLAVYVPEGTLMTTRLDDEYPAVVGVFGWANSPVSTSKASNAYLSHFCRMITEQRARAIHPALFEYLERG